MPCGRFASKVVLCVKSTRCPRDGTPVSGSSCAVPPQKSVGWVIFCSSRLLGCLEIQNGHKRLGVERTTMSSLVPFQPATIPTRSKYALKSLRWPSSFTQHVYAHSKKKELLYCCTQHCSTQQYCCIVAHGFSTHFRSIPWATSNRQTSQLALRRGVSRTARNLFTPSHVAVRLFHKVG